MKRLACLVLIAMLVVSVAVAESVTQKPYELVVESESRIGKYTGNMVNGKPEGYGIFTTTNPNGFSWHYIGNWKNGLMHGEGAIYWEDGSLEIGEYDNGVFVFGYFNYDGADLALYSDNSIERTSVAVDDNSEQSEQEVQYIGNKNSHVFHHLWCDSVAKMSEKNKIELYTREEAEGLGYKPCDRCKP